MNDKYRVRINNNHYLASDVKAGGYEEEFGTLNDLNLLARAIVNRYEGDLISGQYPDGSNWYGGNVDNPLVIVEVVQRSADYWSVEE